MKTERCGDGDVRSAGECGCENADDRGETAERFHGMESIGVRWLWLSGRCEGFGNGSSPRRRLRPHSLMILTHGGT